MSILSDRIAQRCNLMRLVDKRFQATVHGVGGAQTLVGKIHACKLWHNDYDSIIRRIVIKFI